MVQLPCFAGCVRGSFGFREAIVIALLVGALALLNANGVECGRISSHGLEYPAISCRAHGVSLEDFGVVGDGLASNATEAAIDHLSQFLSQGGSQLIVLLATQDVNE